MTWRDSSPDTIQIANGLLDQATHAVYLGQCSWVMPEVGYRCLADASWIDGETPYCDIHPGTTPDDPREAIRTGTARQHWDYLTGIAQELERRGDVDHAQVFRDTRWRRFPHGPVEPPKNPDVLEVPTRHARQVRSYERFVKVDEALARVIRRCTLFCGSPRSECPCAPARARRSK